MDHSFDSNQHISGDNKWKGWALDMSIGILIVDNGGISIGFEGCLEVVMIIGILIVSN